MPYLRQRASDARRSRIFKFIFFFSAKQVAQRVEHVLVGHASARWVRVGQEVRAAMFKNQYDTDVTTWSPQGRLFQVEYAEEAVKQGSASVGVTSNTHVVLASLKR